MATQAKRSRTLRTASTQALIAGIQKHLGSTSLTLDNTVYAAANIVTMLQGQVTADNAVIAAEAAFHDAVKQDQNPVLAAFMVKLVQAIRIMYASAPAVLADFGVAPPKPRAVSPATQVLAAAKALATRKARNTMGSVEKKSVKGTVTSVTVNPEGSSASPATPAAEQGGLARQAPATSGTLGTSGSVVTGH